MQPARTIGPALGLLLAALTSAAARAEIAVTAIGRDLDSLERTEEVRHFRFEEGEENDLLEVGTALGVGDELTALTDQLFIELACPEGSLLRFTGSFRLTVNRPLEDQDCRIDTRDGKLDLLSESPTETCVAGVCLATSGTRYASRLERGGDGLERRVLVFEGAVDVAAGRERKQVVTGQQLELRRAAAGGFAFAERPVNAGERARWADLYARFDVVRARAAGVELSAAQVETARTTFRDLHAKVLEAPDAPEPRAELAATQVAYKLDREALYNAKRSGLVTSQELEERQIDPKLLRRGDAAERQRFEVLIRDRRPATGTNLTGGTAGVVRPPGGFVVQPDLLRARTALEVNPPAGANATERAIFWRRHVADLEASIARNEMTSRRYLLLARAHQALGGASSAAGYAGRALRLVERDSLLTDEEIAVARRLAAAD